jgi:hypothetical protein
MKHWVAWVKGGKNYGVTLRPHIYPIISFLDAFPKYLPTTQEFHVVGSGILINYCTGFGRAFLLYH